MQHDLKEMVILVTRANTGIGKAASLQLAKYGATVVVACLSSARGFQALREVQQAANSLQVYLMDVYMSSKPSIRNVVNAFFQRNQRLDVMIHNATNFEHAQQKPVLTEDGIETIFATNHLGPFLMTQLLLDVLKSSAPSRIITVASKGLISYPFLDIELDNLNGERKFSMQQAYYHSKEAQVMFTFDLAKRLKGTGVTVHCVRVGNVTIPDERLAHLPKFLLKLYEMKRKFSMTPEQMAETYVWLAAEPLPGKITGGYRDAPNVGAHAMPIRMLTTGKPVSN